MHGQKPDVALCVDRVVKMPVGYRGSRESHLEDLRRLEHCVQGHVPTVAPAPYSNAFRVYIGLPFEPLDTVSLIRKLLGAETIMDRLFENVAAPHGTAIVQRKNDVALLRHEL